MNGALKSNMLSMKKFRSNLRNYCVIVQLGVSLLANILFIKILLTIVETYFGSLMLEDQIDKSMNANFRPQDSIIIYSKCYILCPRIYL